MDHINLEDEYSGLTEEVRIGSLADHELQITEFFNIYAALAAENGDTPDLEYSPILREGNKGYRVDGYALDITAGDGEEAGDLYLVVCDYRQQEEMPTINAKDIDRAVDQAVRFYRSVSESGFMSSLEESSPAFQVAALINQYGSRIRRLRIIVFSNGHLRTRKNVFEKEQLGNVTVHINVIDLARYARISSTGSEPVAIDFEADFGGAIECLPASTGADSYHSYLFAIPGKVLAEVFAVFGNRLLEQNVRTYLQARTNVNKGILKTIADEPRMFFAYNNGITGTASSVRTKRLENGALGITFINDFQIVNGGQTTASLLYARDGQGRDLGHVFVQVKLSVVGEDQIGEVVPRISEYANTQNKVSLADLASNSPVQIKIDRLSKEISAPPKAGDLYGSKWFYERARGQYKSLFAYKSQAERKRLEIEYPKDHLITKTDLARFELSFDGEPHTVSAGAQKCFLRYSMNVLSKLGENTGAGVNETWFKRAIAKAILFKSLDNAIQQSAWYKADRGHKAPTTTYTIAACADGFQRKGLQIDLDRIWQSQEVAPPLLNWMLSEAEKVARIIKSPPANVRNSSEYAKKPHCWESGVSGNAGVPSDAVTEFGVPIQDFQDGARSGKREGKRNQELDFDLALVGLVQRVADIREQAARKGLESPQNLSALSKLCAGNFNLAKMEKKALKLLLDRLDIEY